MAALDRGSQVTLSVVIPTLNRGEVLLGTLELLLKLRPAAVEILVIDQTERQAPVIEEDLRKLEARGTVRRVRLRPASIPAAMNRGLCLARGNIVLFVDDDVAPSTELFAAHLAAHAARKGEIIAGQVLQPGEIAEPLTGSRYAFRSSVPQEVREVIGCNFSVDRDLALRVGGFDELFVKVAYRFEADFADRARAAGATIFHEPKASLRHLKAPRGGTRAYGDFLKSFSPSHSVGEYYYLLRRRPSGFLRSFLARPFKAIATRHHLRQPWWIPATLLAETLGACWGSLLTLRRPKLLDTAAVVKERA